MIKNISDSFFSIDELTFISLQVWWVACNSTPYLVRGGVVGKGYVIQVTNMKDCWNGKSDQQQINCEKQEFNSSIIDENGQNLLDTLDQLLKQGTNQLKFTQQNSNLILLIEKKLGIYPFKWRFQLEKNQNFDISSFITSNLISPLLSTIGGLQNSIENMKYNYKDLENQYLKKLKSPNKDNYQSKLDDNWQQFVQDKQQGTYLQLSDMSRYFYQQNFIQGTQSGDKNDKKNRIQIPYTSKSQSNDLSQNTQESDKILKKKKKKIDFA